MTWSKQRFFHHLLLCAYHMPHVLILSVDASLPLWPQHLKTNKVRWIAAGVWSQYFENMSPMLEESKFSGACCAKIRIYLQKQTQNWLKTWFWQKHPFQPVRIAVYNSLPPKPQHRFCGHPWCLIQEGVASPPPPNPCETPSFCGSVAHCGACLLLCSNREGIAGVFVNIGTRIRLVPLQPGFSRTERLRFFGHACFAREEFI